MKVNNITTYSFILMMAVFSTCTTTREKPQEITAQVIGEFDIPVQLQIEISCDNYEVSMNDSIVFDIKISNVPVNDNTWGEISVFNPLKLGADGGLTITVIDIKGNEVFAKKESKEQLVQPVIDDSWPYSILPLNHYMGTIYQDSVKNIFRNPGKYYVFAEYLSPVTKNDMEKYGTHRNFWGREIGIIRSVPLEIKVTR